jgi:hypothetical protein
VGQLFLRGLVLASLFAVACYNPQLGDAPGYFCHEFDNPACPDGQFCLNGRCVQNGGLMFDGGAPGMHPPGHDGGYIPPSQHDMNNPQQGGYDLSGGGTTMSGCHGYSQCFITCADINCVMSTCDPHVTANGKMLFDNALGCGQLWCLGPNAPTPGPGPGVCMIDTLTMQLVDSLTALPGDCANCIANATAGLFSMSCSPPSDPNCNPTQCNSQYVQCQGDLP